MAKADARPTISVSEGDVQAITALFKRIAERGHRIRTGNKLTADNPGSAPLHDEHASNQPPGQTATSS